MLGIIVWETGVGTGWWLRKCTTISWLRLLTDAVKQQVEWPARPDSCRAAYGCCMQQFVLLLRGWSLQDLFSRTFHVQDETH